MIKLPTHEKLQTSIQKFLIDNTYDLPYYGEFNLFLNFKEQETIKTCAVNVTQHGMNFYYNSEFLYNLSEKEVNFILLHEDFHLLFDHPQRTISGQYKHKLSNIAQDMIINHIIWQDIDHNIVEIPKDEKGKNMALFVPSDYDGPLIFESLYEWLRDEMEKWEKNCKCKTCGGSGDSQEDDSQENDSQENDSQENDSQENDSQENDSQGDDSQEDDSQEGGGNNTNKCPDCGGSGQKDGSENSDYGKFGKNPNYDKGKIDTWSKEKIFKDLENGGEGEYLDSHIDDEVNKDIRKNMTRDVKDSLKSRGFSNNNIENTLNKLQKKRKDYLKYIKRAVSQIMNGTNKQKSITRRNRRNIDGLKGKRKVKSVINCILDTSGSMGGTFEKVISYIYRSDIEVNLIEADTDVKWVQNIKNKRKIESLKIVGLGGTILQPALDFVEENFNKHNTVILTDGYCDSLNLTRIKGRVLIITIGTKVPIHASNSKVKQIVVDINE